MSDKHTIGEIAARLVVELVVVFVGVYAAFALTEWQADGAEAARKAQIEQALVREIRGIVVNTRRGGASATELAAAFDSALAAGDPMLPVPLIEPIRVEAHMWEATLASGGLDLLEVETFYRLSEFYNELNAGFGQLEQLRTLSETMLIPNLGGGVDEFYDSEGRLRPRYRWYIQGLRNVSWLAGRITELGDEVVAELSGDASDGLGD